MPHSLLAQRGIDHGSGSLDAGARWLAAMRAGAFGEAWTVSDAVLGARDPATRDDPSVPYHLRWVWDGRPFEGRRVLVRCYHGLGDTLQFCRYLPMLRRCVRHLTVEAQPELVPLLRSIPGPDRVIPFRPEAPAPPSECDIEIMELAHALRLAPQGAAYFSVDPLPRPAVGMLVGLCWRAGGWDPGRSVPLPALAALGRVPGVQLISLQRGPGLDELAVAGAPAVFDTGDRSGDAMTVGRLLATLDLVITVDTMAAHLAGALGRPTWLLLQAEADWRWMTGDRSVWYDSVRLYRQSDPGVWSAPLAELQADLVELVQLGPVQAGLAQEEPLREPCGDLGFVGLQGLR